MKCPMIMYNYLPGESPTEGSHSDCIKEKCAWWDSRGVRCGIMSLVERLGWIGCAIRDKGGG